MKTIKIILLSAALTMAWGCSTKDDGIDQQNTVVLPALEQPSAFTLAERPDWRVDLTGNDAAPGWQNIDRSLYESWMYVTVRLQDELAATVSADDRMVAYIGNECRTVPAEPSNKYADGSVYFVLTIGGNNADNGLPVRLSYYSNALHSLFTIESTKTFVPEAYIGNAEDFVPPLLQGCKRYPVQNTLTVSLPAEAPFTAVDGDLMAVFAGDECRGVGIAGRAFTVFRTSAEESLQLRYYSAQKGGIYTVAQPIALAEGDAATVTLNV